jgi:hypothetical protein
MEWPTDGQQHTRLGDPGRVYPYGFQVVRTRMRSEHDTIKHSNSTPNSDPNSDPQLSSDSGASLLDPYWRHAFGILMFIRDNEARRTKLGYTELTSF